MKRHAAVVAGLMLAGAATGGFAAEAKWPARSIRFVVPFAPGGPSDVLSRLMGQKLGEALGQTLVVDNRGSVGGIVGFEIAVQSPPDGYTLLLSANSLLTINPHVYKKLPYDPFKDLQPVTQLTSGGNVVVVHPSVAAKNIKELIALAKASPGKLNYATTGTGNVLGIAAFREAAGIDMVPVAYKGTGQAVIDLVAGHVQFFFMNPLVAITNVKSGKLRALAVTSLTRNPSLPDVPTVDESGVPKFENITWHSVLVPAGTSKAIVARLNTELVRIVNLPDIRERFLSQGLTPVGSTPEQMSKLMRQESAEVAKLVKKINFQLLCRAVPGLIACGAAAAAAAAEPAFPNRPLRVVVPFTAGSATDVITRIVMPPLMERWGKQAVTDNRPSAGGIIACTIVAEAPPDGHTLLVTGSNFAGSAALYSKLPFDPVRDFAGITQFASTPLVLVVAPNLGVKTAQEFIAYAKARPGKLNYGSTGLGSGPHYGAELFKLATGIQAVHVPYRGSPESLTDLMSGRVQFILAPVLAVTPLVKSGRILALGVSTTYRAQALPDVPTLGESALPGFEYQGWYGALLPSKTPRTIVNLLAKEIAQVLGRSEIQERIANQGAIAKSSSPDAFDKLVHNEIDTRKKVWKAAGVKVE
jgi:tripartite-type tricarboxylate transporter receptor subunit TctC